MDAFDAQPPITGEPPRSGFSPRDLDRSIIAIPLLREMRRSPAPGVPLEVVIDLNLNYHDGRDSARTRVQELIRQAIAQAGSPDDNDLIGSRAGQYLVARLEPEVIVALVALDGNGGTGAAQRAIFRIWPDFPVRALLDHSGATIKADAARASFAASGDDIVWAVLDSGVDVSHPHFQQHANLKLSAPLRHENFLRDGDATKDAYGHGTHVAGIIAGAMRNTRKHPIAAVRCEQDEKGNVRWRRSGLTEISGIAPKCRIVSYRVLDDQGRGSSSTVLDAIEEIQRINEYGRRLKIHGANLSLGYDFNPEWFACGQSPLCVEVNRLVRSGVCVVVAAGNSGYAYAFDSDSQAQLAAGRALTINDPGNADEAITVGSTHRDMPHRFGVSYFSSKGPTGDGRAKPDLVAPGERILSAATGSFATVADAQGMSVNYVENSGTSMAAPHVSGVIAAFLSIRREFIGQPQAVKRIFTSTATDLGRVPEFQGRGLVDLMRAIQSV